VLCNDGAQRHNQQVLKAIDNTIEEGDIIVSIKGFIFKKEPWLLYINKMSFLGYLL